MKAAGIPMTPAKKVKNKPGAPKFNAKLEKAKKEGKLPEEFASKF